MLEYLAAGRPVVSTDLPAARWLDTPHVTVADHPAAFAVAVVEAAAVAHRPDLVADRRALAATHSWDSRVAALARAIGLPPADRDPGGRPRATTVART
jgi:teichuronic acid biosynthesis glycosyltransferase TuaH